jgi:NTE family protein
MLAHDCLTPFRQTALRLRKRFRKVGSGVMTSRHQEAIDLLEDLPAAARKALLSRERRLTLEAGQPLFEAGEPAEALYIVNKGTLAVYIDRPGTGRHLLALIRQGEVIGEMAVISGGPRTASAVAIRDSELITVPASEFRELQRRYPQLALGLNRLLVRRLRQTSLGGPRSEPKTNAVIPASQGVDPEDFARRLAEELQRMGAAVHVVPPGDDDTSPPDLARLEAAHDHVFLCGHLQHREWSDMCARQADRIIALVPAEGSLDARFPRTLLAQRATHQLANLVLLHRSPADRPLRSTGQWLDTLNPSRHFHLRAKAKRDWQHLARVIAGTSVGLVLSGGGARAFAHIGVLRAIEDAQIPIDFIGGSSMGAIIAACHASGWSSETILERFRASAITKNPLSDYSLPLIGLVRGHRVERLLESAFGDTHIPDLWRPYFCVSTNLTTATVHVHRRGRLRDALRASVSLPGILPPVSTPEGVLVDGGVMDNLPVETMRVVNHGPIVAVDVTRDLAITPQWLKEVQSASLLSRIMNPPIVSILMRAGTVSNEDRARNQLDAAELVITPPLGDIDIRDWKAYDQAVEIGRRHAAGVLALEADCLLKPHPPE